MAKVRVSIEGRPDREYPVGDRLTIGRKSDNDIVVKDNLCSRQHAEITEKGGTFHITDLDSHNGTKLNGISISSTVLKDGDVISAGSAEITFLEEELDPILGERVAGYHIISKLGEGGMGSVYKARQISMDRMVALKVLSQQVSEDSDYIKAFVQEAKVAGQLNHTNVVNVHDFGKTDEGLYYLSMEFVAGDNIQQLLDEKGKLEVEQSTIIISQVADALEFAHEHAIVHSDIKPQNILLSNSGRVKLADLGLAKYYGRGRFDHQTDVVMGTPLYMSPEQATKSPVDSRSDIYSLGATFFHMITGRPPFDGDTALTILTKHVTEDVPSPRKYDVTISRDLARFVTWMMEKEPEDRPADIGDLKEKLEEIKDAEKNRSVHRKARKGYAADVRKAMTRKRKQRSYRRNTVKYASVIIPALAVLSAVLLVTVFMPGPTENNEGYEHETQSRAGISSEKRGNDPQMSKKTEETSSSEVEAGSGKDNVSPTFTKKLAIDFSNMDFQDTLSPIGSRGWNRWTFENIKGYLASPADVSTGLRCTGAVLKSNAFSAELTIECTDTKGSFSFYLEGLYASNRMGFHCNPDQVIAFAASGTEMARKNVEFKRQVDSKVIFRITGRPGEIDIHCNSRQVVTIAYENGVFSGSPVIKIDNTGLRIYSIRLESLD